MNLTQVRQKNSQAMSSMEKVSTDDLDSIMSEEQFEEFLGDVEQTSEVLDRANLVGVDDPDDELPRLSVQPQVARAAPEGQEADLTAVSQPGVPYSCEKLVIAYEVTWESQSETNADLISELESRFANQMASDLESLGSVGDMSSSDPFEQIQDGYLTHAESAGVPVYDHSDSGTPQPVNTDVFTNMRSMIPKKYKDQQDDLVFLGSQTNTETYQESLINRETSAGDAMLMTGQEPEPLGYEYITPNSWPETEMLMTSMSNLAYVVSSDVRMRITTQAERNVLADVDVIAAIFAKVDFVLIEPNGAVMATGIEDQTV